MTIGPGPTPVAGLSAAAVGPASAEDEAQRAQQALLERPEVSIRARVAVMFVLLFALCSAGTVAAVLFLSRFEKRIAFLENAGNYSFEIEEARRNEKNFFLYGTGLPEALASASLAQSRLLRSEEEMRSVAGPEGYEAMRGGLDRYLVLLEDLATAEAAGGGRGGVEGQSIEVDLRTVGAELISQAQEMIDRERVAIGSMLHTSMVAAVGFLIFMLLVMVVFGGFMIRAVVRPLDRFLEYVTRIAAGNYEPIRPARRYRDEFSRLALAFNQMLGEIISRQDQLVQSGKMVAVGTLTSGIAHELNNPLNNIGLTVEALSEDFETYTDEEKRRMLEQIHTQVERASSTVKNLLDFTRKDRSAFTAFSLADAVRSALRLVSNEAMLGGVTWSLSLEGDLPRVKGNPHDLQQVFVNLFLNAIQAMPGGGALGVTARLDGDGCVCVDVSDAGVGIPPEHLEEIFDPFFTTKEPGSGTGLGLSVSHSIIEKHGGRITVESEPGKGTKFSVHLPATESH